MASSLKNMSNPLYSNDVVTEVSTGPFTISYRTHLAVGSDEVWQLVSNPHNHHQLNGDGSLTARVTGPTLLQPGNTFHIWMRKFGIPYTLPMRVVTADPQTGVSWQHPAGHIWGWSWVATDDGGCLVTETFDYTQVKPLLLRLWKPAGVFHANAKNMVDTLTQLNQRFS